MRYGFGAALLTEGSILPPLRGPKWRPLHRKGNLRGNCEFQTLRLHSKDASGANLGLATEGYASFGALAPCHVDPKPSQA